MPRILKEKVLFVSDVEISTFRDESSTSLLRSSTGAGCLLSIIELEKRIDSCDTGILAFASGLGDCPSSLLMAAAAEGLLFGLGINVS
jgi:hypothetical protein